MEPVDAVAVGRVLRPWGRHGAVVVEPLTHDVERFRRLDAAWVQHQGGTERRPLRLIRIDRQGRPLVAIQGVDGIEAAERMRDTLLVVPAALAERPVDGFFHHELLGCQVRDRTGSELGRVTEILEAPASSLLVVMTPRGEVLVPFVKAIVVNVDVDREVVTVNPPEGLFDPADSEPGENYRAV